MESSPRIGLLIAGGWLVICGIWCSLGVFWPERRGRWGRRGREGGRMSVLSQLLWTIMLVFVGVAAISSAYHKTWLQRLFPFAFFPLLAAMFITGWCDSRTRQKNDNEMV